MNLPDKIMLVSSAFDRMIIQLDFVKLDMVIKITFMTVQSIHCLLLRKTTKTAARLNVG